jgi:3'(2'), 5'-bisphosphate nucleotidase
MTLKTAEISLSALAPILIEAAAAGGRALLASGSTEIILKPDGTPVTPADLASDRAIQNILRMKCPNTRCVSEENIGQFTNEDAEKPFFLIDPLDGTKEFIAGHTDFAVCIGYIVKQRPVAGIILAPKRRKAWLATNEATGFDLDSQLNPITKSQHKLLPLETKSRSLRIVTSRSHADPHSLALIAKNPGAIHKTLGSAVKFTALADGEVDLYPRGSGTMEWDTAAGEAILLAAGGMMLDLAGKPLLYGQWQKAFRNEQFIAASSYQLAMSALAQWQTLFNEKHSGA